MYTHQTTSNPMAPTSAPVPAESSTSGQYRGGECVISMDTPSASGGSSTSRESHQPNPPTGVSVVRRDASAALPKNILNHFSSTKEPDQTAITDPVSIYHNSGFDSMETEITKIFDCLYSILTDDKTTQDDFNVKLDNLTNTFEARIHRNLDQNQEKYKVAIKSVKGICAILGVQFSKAIKSIDALQAKYDELKVDLDSNGKLTTLSINKDILQKIVGLQDNKNKILHNFKVFGLTKGRNAVAMQIRISGNFEGSIQIKDFIKSTITEHTEHLSVRVLAARMQHKMPIDESVIKHSKEVQPTYSVGRFESIVYGCAGEVRNGQFKAGWMLR